MVCLNSEDSFFKKREQKKRNFSLIKDQGEVREMGTFYKAAYGDWSEQQTISFQMLFEARLRRVLRVRMETLCSA